jgi:UDP-N-acetylmuramoylalanine--D-glutamate ligase
MSRTPLYSGKKIVLFGLGNSGRATAHALVSWGADVSVWDDAEASRARASEEGLNVKELSPELFQTASALVLSPGVPLTYPKPHWTVVAAKEVGLPIIGDIEIFCQVRAQLSPDSIFIAVTGTNGKSTTTSLIAHLLAVDGRDVVVGGNLGPPILSLPLPSSDRIHVIECSSFQIDLTPTLTPTIGILTNLTPDHLDRHGTMDNYALSKERLIAGSNLAIVSVSDPYSVAIAQRRAALSLPVLQVTTDPKLKQGLLYQGTHIFKSCDDELVELADLSGLLSLRGAHNTQNAAAALAAVSALGVSEQSILSGLRSFPGLPHRLEAVGYIGNTLVINDSKATNAEATQRALEAYQGRIYWILGGRPKAGGIESLGSYFHRIEKAYVIGEAMKEFVGTLRGRVPVEEAVTLDRAVQSVANDVSMSSTDGSVILFSPACASFDQFRNFEHRGDEFRRITKSMDGFKETSESIDYASAS